MNISKGNSQPVERDAQRGNIKVRHYTVKYGWESNHRNGHLLKPDGDIMVVNTWAAENKCEKIYRTRVDEPWFCEGENCNCSDYKYRMPPYEP